MTTITVKGRGNVFEISPKITAGADYKHAKRTLENIGAHYDSAAKSFVLPMLRVNRLLNSGLGLEPVKGLGDAMRAEAARLRRTAGFIEEYCEGKQLYPFQAEGVGYLYRRQAALLWDEMGLGKTVQALMAIEPGAPALAVVPAFLRKNWAREARLWRKDLEIVEAFDGFQLPEPGQLVVTSYSRLPEAADMGRPWGHTTLIFDEAHYLKTAKTKRTERSRTLAKRVRKVGGHVWLLTGTPLLNKPMELWNLLEVVKLRTQTYGNFHSFCKMFGGRKDAFGYVFDEHPSEEAASVLRHYALRRTRREVLPELPTKTYDILHVDPPNSRSLLAKSLDATDAELIAELLDDSTRDPLEYAHLTTALNSLEEYKAGKVKAYLDTHDEPLVVFGAYKAGIQRLGLRSGWGCIDGGVSMDKRQKIVDDFQAGRLKGLAATVQTMVGWTLTAAHKAVFLGRTWVPGQNEQAEDRICRIGQTRGCQIVDVLADHPLEYALHGELMKKQRLNSATVGKMGEDRPEVADLVVLAKEIEDNAPTA